MTTGRAALLRQPRDPESFCGVPWPLSHELVEGVDLAACYVIRQVRRLESRGGAAYLRLLLADRSGTVDGMVWDDVEHWQPQCREDAIVGIRGRVTRYEGRLQLRVESVEALRVEPSHLVWLLPASPRPAAEMEAELERTIRSVRDPGLRRLLRRCLGAESPTGSAFRVHPAAQRIHHAYTGGLLEHSLSVCSACDAIAAHYARQGVALDRDLLVAGALLHDLGKIRELKEPPASGYSTEGRLLGHIVLGLQIVATEAARIDALEPGRLLLLQHLIASHQGRPEWDSPKVPQLREALVLHYADDLDAKLHQAGTLLHGVGAGEWSEYDRTLARSFFRPPELASPEVEPVAPEDAVELIIDLFRG